MLFGAPDLLTSAIVIITVILGLGTIFLLCGLLYIYWGNYRETKSGYALGLLLFASALLLQNILLTATYFISILDHWYEGIVMFALILFEFIALSILFKISWE
ncbi:MAG: hypothetical protein ABFC34_02105 [Methanobacterium sp.]